MSTIGHEHETIRVEQMKTTLQAYLDRFGGGSGYTKSEADAKFLTITAFENLFNAIGSDGTTKISHPYASGVASIKAMVGVWTNEYLSALGQNAGGGGGGATLFEPLLSINESGLAAPGASQDGMTVVWDNTTQKWKYGAVGGGDYLPLTGGTMRGVITLGHSTTSGNTYSSAINVGIRTINGIRADYYTNGSWIHGGEDNASHLGANVQIGTWYGFGIYPTISGMTRTQGQNSFWHNARTGNTYTWGDFYCYDGTNNNKVATEKWVKENTVDYLGDIAVDFNFADMHDLGGGVYQLHTNNTQTHKPTTYGILVDFESTNGHLQLAAGADETLYVRSYWWTGNPDGFTYPGWKTLATKEWISQNYISIAFFNRLFQAKNGSTNVNPNDMITTIDNIKAMFGFWTDQYLSALGQNSGGGGGGGSTTLAGLNDVDLGTLSNGQVLMYNSTTGKWYNGTVQHGSTVWGDITGTPTTIAGYGITDAKIVNGVITLGSNTITPLTSVTFNDLTSHPTTIAGYGITDAKFGTAGADYVPITLGSTTKNVLTAHQSLSAYATQTWVTNNFLGINATAAAAAKLATARTLWGQSFDGTAAVTGTLSYVGDINSNALGSINNFNKIELNAAANAGNGGAIYFHYNGISGRASGYIINDADGLVSVLTSTGNIGLKVGTQTGDYLQIGAVRLMYDASNNALKVIKSDGTAANFYATGGVSALGVGSGGGSIQNLTMTGTLKFSVNSMDSTIYADNDGYLHIDGSENITMGNDLVTDGYSIYTRGGNVECGTGKVYASRFYVGTGRYIYLDGTTLKYNDNGTVKTIVLS